MGVKKETQYEEWMALIENYTEVFDGARDLSEWHLLIFRARQTESGLSVLQSIVDR